MQPRVLLTRVLASLVAVPVTLLIELHSVPHFRPYLTDPSTHNLLLPREPHYANTYHAMTASPPPAPHKSQRQHEADNIDVPQLQHVQHGSKKRDHVHFSCTSPSSPLKNNGTKSEPPTDTPLRKNNNRASAHQSTSQVAIPQKKPLTTHRSVRSTSLYDFVISHISNSITLLITSPNSYYIALRIFRANTATANDGPEDNDVGATVPPMPTPVTAQQPGPNPSRNSSVSNAPLPARPSPQTASLHTSSILDIIDQMRRFIDNIRNPEIRKFLPRFREAVSALTVAQKTAGDRVRFHLFA